MYRASAVFLERLRAGENPLLVVALSNAAGTRLYGTSAPPPDAFGWVEPKMADGSGTAGGAVMAGYGTAAVLARRGALRGGGRINETLTPQRGGLAGSLGSQEAGRLTARLSNGMEAEGTRHFSRMAAAENILGAEVLVRAVFPGLTGREDGLDRFRGRVRRYRLSREELVIEARAV